MRLRDSTHARDLTDAQTERLRILVESRVIPEYELADGTLCWNWLTVAEMLCAERVAGGEK